MTYTPKESTQYRLIAAAHAKHAMTQSPLLFPWRTSVSLEVHFFRDSNRKCDLDNLLKNILDGLTTAKLWLDDSQVVSIEATKNIDRSNPRAEITVTLEP